LHSTASRLRALSLTALIAVVLASALPLASAAAIDTVPSASSIPSTSPAPSTGSIASPAPAGGVPTPVAATAVVAPNLGVTAIETGLGPVAPAPAVVVAAKPLTIAASARIVALARSHLGARYRYGATGPGSFDCSGLVYRVFTQAGLGRTIRNLHSSQALYTYFLRRHMTSRSAPEVGDLVVFGGGSHVGIYIGGGRVLHAMVQPWGVRITSIWAVYPRFTTYIHLHLGRIRLPLTR
jgi:cell wall-associated NlpC family hydrolase